MRKDCEDKGTEIEKEEEGIVKGEVDESLGREAEAEGEETEGVVVAGDVVIAVDGEGIEDVEAEAQDVREAPLETELNPESAQTRIQHKIPKSRNSQKQKPKRMKTS